MVGHQLHWEASVMSAGLPSAISRAAGGRLRQRGRKEQPRTHEHKLKQY